VSAPGEPDASAADGLRPLGRSPLLHEQVVQQLIPWAAAAAMTAHIDLVPDVPLPADEDRARLRSGRASRPRG
jgi:hypothetical protein